VGYASVLVGGAAEAGALALAAGADPQAGVKEALPGWSQARARIAVSGGEVKVHLRPPSPLHALADRLEVSAEAEVEQPGAVLPSCASRLPAGWVRVST
jgi:hypothetical protein